MSATPSRVGALRPALRTIAVRGGAVDPDGFCEQALRALHAEVSDQPRVLFEAYLAHLRSCGAELAVVVEAADELPPATSEWLARWARRPAGALRLVAAGARDEKDAQERGVRAEPPSTAKPPDAGSTALVARGRRRSIWPVGAAGLVAVLASGLLWSFAGDEQQRPPARVVTTPAATTPPVDAAPAGELHPDAPGTTAPAQAEAAPLDAALDALEAGDADAYRRAIRSIRGPAARQAEAELVQRLEELRSEDRERRMLAAWGLALVGGRDALPSLDIAAGGGDPHVAALASRSAAVIRARLAAGGSDAGGP